MLNVLLGSTEKALCRAPPSAKPTQDETQDHRMTWKYDQDSRSRSAVLLGVSLDASEEEVKKAYRQKAKKMHPDTSTGAADFDGSSFADLREAYECMLHISATSCHDKNNDVYGPGMRARFEAARRWRERRGTHVDTSSFSRVDSSELGKRTTGTTGPQRERKSQPSNRVQTSNDSAENVFSTSHELADDVLLEEVLSRHKRAKTSSRAGVQRSTSSAASWSLPQVVSARTPRQITLFLGLTGCVAVTAAVGYTNNVVF